jgi:hypothetical protein
MTTYEGRAILITPDGGRVPVDVQLQTAEVFYGADRQTSWSGWARPVDVTSLFGMIGQTVTIEHPDGSTGRAVINSGDLGLTVGLLGSGPPPFEP